MDNGATPSWDGRQQLLEAGPRNAIARAAKTVIDEGDIAPAALPRPICKSILTRSLSRLLAT
ncbi:hypothetical protein BST63_16350 [Bradyrhizobium canariense]|uniref:Uncharacterized protein n=1 Tax=Bradyrhizobium canariense TaxID=255045 RepID=A0ABX3X3J8_9BRAD|nr:hypothetical protein BST63_16350 [Bradyrhizobium canariense]